MRNLFPSLTEPTVESADGTFDRLAHRTVRCTLNYPVMPPDRWSSKRSHHVVVVDRAPTVGASEGAGRLTYWTCPVPIGPSDEHFLESGMFGQLIACALDTIRCTPNSLVLPDWHRFGYS
jgi:hypothetical protein